MSRNRPYSHFMTDSLEATTDSLFAGLDQISDLVERYQAIKNLETRLDKGLKAAKAEVALGLYEDHTWGEVGELLGVTGSRAEQISRAAR